MSFTGFVNKTYCNMLSWQWYHNLPVRVLFDHLLRFIGNENNVNNGSVLISIDKLAKDSCLTINQVRLALIKLESSNDVSVVSYGKKGSLITIKDWERYQNLNHEENHEETTNKPQTQHPKNNDVTSLTTNNTTNKPQIKSQISENNTQKTVEPQTNHKQTTNKLNSQMLEFNNNTNTGANDTTNKPQINHEQTQSPEKQEKEEIPPTPSKEDKEKKEHISSCACVCEDAQDDQQQLQLQLDGMTDKTSIPQQSKKTSGKPKANKLTYNKQTHKIEGITKEDMEKWRQMFPYLDIEAEIENEEEYLARPKRKYTDIRRTFENHLKAQQYPPPPNADEVMRIGMERKLDITLEMATRFFNKHQAAGWRNEQWKPILDWRCLLENFVAAWNQNHYGPQTGNFSQSTYGRPTESKPFDPSKFKD